MKACFNAVALPRVILVEDQDGQKSVTNDAEAVVEQILSTYGASIRILYCDTMGKWDEFTHDGAKFTGFRSWDADDWEDVLTRPQFYGETT